MNICFATEVTYENYVNRIKKSSLSWFLETELDRRGISYYISTNLPNNFKKYRHNDSIKIFDIEDLRKNHPTSKQYELFPEDPKGLYPSRYPWNMRRFIIEKAAQDGYNYVIYIDADNMINPDLSTDDIINTLVEAYEPNTISTNSAVFKYEGRKPDDVFQYHDKYIKHFNLKFKDEQYDTIDGPVQVFMGDTNEDILRFVSYWHKFTDFGYAQELGVGYGNNKHGNLSFIIPISNFKLKWKGFPISPHHRPEDRY